MPGKIVSREEWVAARKDLLTKEKAVLRASDSLNSQLREFPMVKLDQSYTFEGPDGEVSLIDLFHGRKQLIVYHFMLGPDFKAGCPGCSFLADNLPTSLEHLHYRDTTLVLVSRAPIAQIETFKKRMGWKLPWYSSNGSTFNYDFHVSQDEKIAPISYNFKDKETILKEGPSYSIGGSGEQPGLSVFFQEGKEVFHTYSTYARGLEGLLGTHRLLDMTPLGRQSNGMEWKLHDEYSGTEAKGLEH